MASLPTNISDLIERFKASKDNEEKDALREWCKKATNQILTPSEIPKCPWEMARLAEVLSDENPRNLGNFENLVRHFVNAIVDGTMDGTALNPILWRCMAHIIRHGDGKPSNGVLGPLFQSLMDRLDKAKKQGNFEVQYEFTCVLGTVVDAMADIGVSSISHEDMQRRLLEILKSLKESEELHLAHAAEYASQALRGIPDDDTTFKALLRGFIRTTDIAMSVFGAAYSPDPGKIWTAIKDTVKGVLDLEEHLYDRLRQHTGKSWYTALRTTRAFIGTRNIEGLVTFIKEAECREDPKFLCGLYFQLEQPQATPDMHGVRLYHHLPSSKDSRVQAWSEFSKSGCNGSGEVKIRHWAFKKLKEDTFQFSLRASAIEKITPSNDEWPSFLSQAFTRCSLAKKYYAKAELERYYTDENSGRLMIQRLSNDVLSMDQCYINLEVQDTSAGDEISLPKLFEPRKGDNGRMIHPKRIFIEGQAGVGKTTLCKKIVHDFLHHQQWSTFIDCILWLPLRNLKRISNSYTLKGVFQKQFFSHHRECEALAQTMADVVGAGDDRLLIILDGFDEIAQDWNPDDPMDRISKQLLKHPRVIISSRPNHASKLQTQQLDLRLNTVGFYPDQIEKYIHAPGIMDNREMASEIYSFIKAHPRMLELAQIPVQLDAICYSWEDLCNTFRPDNTPRTMTMTMIYTAVANRLFRKDLARPGERLTEDTVNGKTDSEVENDMATEIAFLEGLAFHGFLANIIEFDHPTREWIKLHLSIQTEENKLKQLSLFRTSDTTLSKNHQNFHFIHLTFQEYFAARYYVKHQCRDKSIHLLPESATDRQMSPQALLAQHKYTTRYDMFWRFVAGYLYIQADNPAVGERPLGNYFRAMEGEPRDIFGPTHQRRVMYCLDEVPKTHFEFEFQREASHKQLCEWVAFESQYSEYRLQLTAEREFPDSVLCRLLGDGTSSVKDKVLQSLTYRRNVSIEVTNIIASWLDRYEWVGSSQQQSWVELLVYNADGLAKNAFNVLIRRLQCDEVWKILPSDSLNPYVVPPAIVDTALDKLNAGDLETRKKALKIMSFQSSSALERVVYHLAAQIHGNDVGIIEPSVAALKKIPEIPNKTLRSIVQHMVQGTQEIKSCLVDLLTSQSPIPDDILCSFGSLVGDLDWRDEEKLIDWHLPLPQSVWQRILLKIENPPKQDLGWKQFGYLMSSQEPVPQYYREKLHEWLQDTTDNGRRRRTLMVLSGQSNLQDHTLLLIKSLLLDDHHQIQCEAIKVLGYQKYLPEELLAAIKEMLFDKKSDIRELALKALGWQSELPHDILCTISRSLFDSDMNVSCEAARALRRTLPQEIIPSLFQNLDHQYFPTRRAIVDAIQIQSDLSLEQVKIFSVKLEDRDYFVRAFTAIALCSHNNLPPHVIQSLFDCCLHDSDAVVRTAAAETLGYQPHLKPEMLYQLSQSSKCWDFSWGKSPIEVILQSQSDLPSDVIRNVTLKLHEMDERIVKDSMNILKNCKEFYASLPHLDFSSLQKFIQVWLSLCFEENCTMYFHNRCIVVEREERKMEIPLSSFHQVKLRLKLNIARMTVLKRPELTGAWVTPYVCWASENLFLVLGLTPVFLFLLYCVSKAMYKLLTYIVLLF